MIDVGFGVRSRRRSGGWCERHSVGIRVRDWFFASNDQRCLSGEILDHMLIDSLHHEFVERCPVLGFEIVAIHGCAEILYRPAAEVGVDLKFLTSINIPIVVDLVFYPVVSKSSPIL